MTLVRSETHHEVATVVCGALHRSIHDCCADIVEDDFDAAVARRFHHDLLEVLLAVVDDGVCSEIATQLHFFFGAHGGDDGRAYIFCDLDRGGARSARSGMNQDRFPSL